ncbi:MULTISPECIES: sulfur carrier protein ThiS [Butyricimonas]|uniref:sulfur carrier protein ThiS n=1 Tax=Butyricimonas TaxID=574697 RepID=UPI0007FB2ED0|nr:MULTISPECIES: sulfur carrier protein ThiS [Butyricimonas]
MQIFINDKSFECPAGATLPEVLEANGIKTDNIAIAVDFSVIPRPEWNHTVLQDGSKIIIIKAVQGG